MKPKTSKIFEWLTVVFITTLIVSNIVSIKTISIGAIVFDAGTILFPLAYIIGDIIAEVYGYKTMRRLTVMGVSMLLLTSVVFWVVGALPADSSWTIQDAYSSTLGVVWRIALASITAILIGELVNAYTLAKMKIASHGKRLWLRLIGSSAIGDAFDTIIFSTLAFAGTMPLLTLVQLILSVYLIKMSVEIIVSPLTMRLITYVKKIDKVDSFENPKFIG